MPSRKSIKQAVSAPIRRGFARNAAATGKATNTALRVDQRTGLPLIRSPRPVTAEDVRALEDD
jgi:hypothetical protein